MASWPAALEILLMFELSRQYVVDRHHPVACFSSLTEWAQGESGVRAICASPLAAASAMPQCVLPAELLVCTEISLSSLALVLQAGHVAPQDSLASQCDPMKGLFSYPLTLRLLPTLQHSLLGLHSLSPVFLPASHFATRILMFVKDVPCSLYLTLPSSCQ